MSKKPARSWVLIQVACVFVIGLLGFAPASAQVNPPPRHPDENPPSLQLPGSSESSPTLKASPVAGAPTTEWAFHKTSDNLHPSAQEQRMVWLMNRARSNPHNEGLWLATTGDPDVAGGRGYFNVDVALMQTQFDGYSPKSPAAFDQRLYLAAKDHSDYMISVDTQTHSGQSGRIPPRGFSCRSWGGIVFAYADNALNAHAAFNIDWTNANPSGMQDPPGHRYAIMAVNTLYTNVGLAQVYEDNPATDVGPYVTTGNFCVAQTGASFPDQYNQFIVGTVWRDVDWDNLYDPGEGVGGVTVTPSTGTYYAITANSGGYAIPVTTAAGDYSVTFSGSGINDAKNVTIGSVSVLLDYVFLPVFTDFVFLPVVRK
jgi:hypothetical protein